jgi:hypothetical protein
MAYMLLIVEPRGQRTTRSALQGRAVYQRMLEYTATLRKRGVLLASDALKSESVRLEQHDGRVQLTDGPFSESKELIGGFILIDCQTRAEALGFAHECPAVQWATIEIREVGTCYE